ncbi:MAG: cysteine desulfurase family protein [Erysipelotrichaceae bacterium]
MIYLDYAATTPIDPEVAKAYQKCCIDYYANSDSLHQAGMKVAELMEQSRTQIADLFHVSCDEIIFTSGASEANNLALKGYAFAHQRRGKHLITSCVEHSSILHTMKQLEDVFGFEVTYLNVNDLGQVDPEELKKALRSDTILVSCMLVNNESGAINDIDTLANITHTFSQARFHCDCVQALGKIAFSLANVDMATFSAHKIYGVKGSGVLFKKRKIELLSLISAGQQEQGLRGGTSNAPANIVFAKTLRLVMDNLQEHYAYVEELNHYLRDALKTFKPVVINSDISGSPYILNISILSIGSQIMLNALDACGICVSAQSTCASKSKAHSYVLKAMGLGELRATHAIRISLSHLTSKADIDQLIKAMKEILNDYQTR